MVIGMKVIKRILLPAVILVAFGTFAQTLDFNVQPDACINERLQPVNSSTGINGDFLWDFCEGELTKAVSFIQVNRLAALDQIAGIQVINSNGRYFALLIDRASGILYRLTFGNDLANIPEAQPVLLPTGYPIVSPQGFKLIQADNQWYGFLASSGNNRLYRLDFGVTVENSPAITELNFSGQLNIPIELELAWENSSYYLGVVNFSGNNLVMARLGESITNQPQSVTSFSLIGAGNPYGFSLKLFADGLWRAVVGSFSNGAFHAVSFVNGLNQPPVVTTITSLLPVIVNPVKLEMETWGEETLMMVITAAGELHRIQFSRGVGLSSVQRTDVLGNFNQSLALNLFYNGGNWYALTFSNGTRDLRILSFETCRDVNIASFAGNYSPIIQFTASGVKDVSLLTSLGGIIYRKTRTITVTASSSPSIDFEQEGICLDSLIGFSPLSDQPLMEVAWTFGDLTTSSLASPTHQYPAAGDYDVQLSVKSDNGCTNFIRRTIRVYSAPIPSFNLPAGIVCTNNELAFINSTEDQYDGNLTYRWYVNNDMVSVNRNLIYSFRQSGDHSIQLSVSIPGCSNDVNQLISNVFEGPAVSFSQIGQCELSSVDFTNATTGIVTDYLWNFGDGQSSTLSNTTHTYSNAGNYDVTLTATNNAGCINSSTKTIPIYSRPQVNFSLPLPPFSCNGLPTQFTDLTPNPFDSNLSSWQWNFGDGQGQSSQRNPQYTYGEAGDYAVSLSVSTNFGCTSTLQKSIAIARSPVPDFSASSLCVDRPITFTDVSQGTILSRQWRIENSSFTDPQIKYRFSTPGSKLITLTVEDQNKCIATLNRSVLIPNALVPDFSAFKPCVLQETAFDDITSDAADPIASRLWTIVGVGSGSNDPQVFTFNNTGNYNVRLDVATQNGCQYSTSRNVLITSAPAADFTFNPSFGAPPLTVQFTNRSAQANNFLWQFGDALNSSSTLTSPSFTYITLGDYPVSLAAANALGCVSTITKSVQVVIPVYAVSLNSLELLPASGGAFRPAITVSNDSNVPLMQLPVRFDLPEGVVIRDYINETILPGQAYRYVSGFELPAAGNLGFICAVAEIADDNPSDNQLCTALENPVVVFDPYPNPVSGSQELIVQWIARNPVNTQITILNALGQIMEEVNSLSQTGLNSIRFSTEGWKQGMYMVQIRQEGGFYTFRVVRAN